MNFQDVYKKIAEDLNYLFSVKADSLKYDKTFRAKVIDNISEKKCKILYKGKECIVKCDGNVNVNDMVWVCAPRNDWNELYIQSYTYQRDSSSSTSGVIGIKGNSESTYRTGNVNITAENIGLEKVNNTSDLDKPISSEQKAAINTKVPVSTFNSHINSKDHDARYYTKNISNNYFKKFEIYKVNDVIDLIDARSYIEKSYVCNIVGIDGGAIFVPIGCDTDNVTVEVSQINGISFNVRWHNHNDINLGGMFSALFLVIYSPIDLL
ncbi:hypothetical protein [Lacrimispora sp.]|uniref:hypothetical protein n=1 Tax=Lacrimispora sp. TaxID=2719234 RepID=UPI0028B01673|nr:hypothetical protein [Lacrimispora sp.]